MLQSPAALFGILGNSSLLLLLGLFLAVFVLIVVASLHTPGAKPRAIGMAIYCTILQAIGILLMTLGGLPATFGVIARQPYDDKTYVALLLIFSTGGLTYLWHERLLRSVDGSSRAVAETCYFFFFKLLGFGSAVFAFLYLILTLLYEIPVAAPWWEMPVLLFSYGLLLSWSTRVEDRSPASFRSSPLPSSLRPSPLLRPVTQKIPGTAKVLPKNPAKPSSGKSRKGKR